MLSSEKASWPETLDQAFIREALMYNPFTGHLRWRERPKHHFRSADAQKKWNARFAGHRAGQKHKTNHYRYVKLQGKPRFEHTVVWVFMHDELPEMTDHENGMRDANWIRNLRDVSKLVNGQNQRRPTHNTSGVMGVNLDKRSGRWRAYIKVGQQNKSLGYFGTFEEAVAARLAGEAAHGYHPNHGRG